LIGKSERRTLERRITPPIKIAMARKSREGSTMFNLRDTLEIILCPPMGKIQIETLCPC
jgi:hypothetical protein